MARYFPINVNQAKHFCEEMQIEIGVFVLSSDQGFEADLITLLPRWVKVNVVRMPSYINCASRGSDHKDELFSTAKLLADCVGIEYAIYGCTSGELIFGKHYIIEALNSVLPDVHVIAPISATIDACKELSLDLISILSPYDRALNRKLCDEFKSNGISVENVYEFALQRDASSSRLNRHFFEDAAKIINENGSKALFVPCNALSVVKHISSMEAHLDLPVLTSTQVSVWKILRLSRPGSLTILKKFGAIYGNDGGGVQ